MTHGSILENEFNCQAHRSIFSIVSAFHTKQQHNQSVTLRTPQ